jgi:hypothetical protein
MRVSGMKCSAFHAQKVMLSPSANQAAILEQAPDVCIKQAKERCIVIRIITTAPCVRCLKIRQADIESI